MENVWVTLVERNEIVIFPVKDIPSVIPKCKDRNNILNKKGNGKIFSKNSLQIAQKKRG
jgi:hypothetical protein